MGDPNISLCFNCRFSFSEKFYSLNGAFNPFKLAASQLVRASPSQDYQNGDCNT